MNERDEAQRRAFLEMIVAAPLDEVTRRVFSDWLEEHGLDDEAAIQRAWTPAKYKEALAFFEDLAELYDRTVALLLAGGHAWLDHGKYISIYGVSDHSVEPEFWEHFVILTGRPVPDDEREVSILTCSC